MEGKAGHLDTLIVGQGLAGTLLAWALLEREPQRRLLIVDREDGATASRVAAGLVTPITGQRLVKSWRLEDMSAAALPLYRRVEQRLGRVGELFRDKSILRLLNGEREVQRWRRRLAEPGYRGWLRDAQGDTCVAGESEEVRGLRDEWGRFEMRAWHLDVPEFLDASRAWFARRGMYRRAELASIAAAIDIRDRHVRVPELAVTAGELVFCQGWRAGEGDLFDWVPFRPGKGELMEVRIDGQLQTGGRIVNRGGWLMPLGGDRYRCGSTYSWDRIDCEPTGEGRLALEEKLRGILESGLNFSVTGQSAAVRPVIRESRALMGRHPAAGLERVCFFNGLGSKGVLNGPYFARQLASHLVNGEPIEGELDLRRNL